MFLKDGQYSVTFMRRYKAVTIDKIEIKDIIFVLRNEGHYNYQYICTGQISITDSTIPLN